MSATIAITGASSFAARPLLHALRRPEPRQVVLCDPLDGLAELQAQLLPWCEQQRISTQQLLVSLPESGVSLLFLSSHLAVERHGVAGSTLAADEALVAQ